MTRGELHNAILGAARIINKGIATRCDSGPGMDPLTKLERLLLEQAPRHFTDVLDGLKLSDLKEANARLGRELNLWKKTAYASAERMARVRVWYTHYRAANGTVPELEDVLTGAPEEPQP